MVACVLPVILIGFVMVLDCIGYCGSQWGALVIVDSNGVQCVSHVYSKLDLGWLNRFKCASGLLSSKL